MVPTPSAPDRMESPMSNATVVSAFFERLGAGDVPGALALMHDQVRLTEPDGLPTGGEYVGRDGFVSFLEKTRSVYEATIHAQKVSDAGDVTLVEFDATFTSRATGAHVDTRIVELYTVVDGLITHIDVYPKDSRAMYEITLPGQN